MWIGTLTLVCSSASAQISCLTGFVTDPSGAPVVGADLDFDDAKTGERQITPGDNTDATGRYALCFLSPGVFHVSFAPPLGTNLVGRRFFDFSVQPDSRLNVTLEAGVVISGVITDSFGAPIGGVDIDVDSVGAGRVYTPDDDTDTLFVDGVYRIVTPAHLFRLRFDPPIGSRFRGAEIDSVQIQNDTTINITLSGGWLISGQILDNFNAPAVDVDVDLRSLASGKKIFLSNNSSDTSGMYSVAAPAGQFRMEFSPPPGSALVGVALDTLTISSDNVINVTLNTGNRIRAIVTDENGAPVAGADLDIALESSRIRQFTPHDKTDAIGRATVTVAPDIYEIRIDPPPGTLLDQVVLRNVNITTDTTILVTLPPLNRVNVRGQVVGAGGNGLADITIGAISLTTGSAIKVKNGRTNFNGYFVAGVPFGLVDLQFIPPAPSRYIAVAFSGVSLLQDTVLAPVVLDLGVIVTMQVVKTNGDPARDYEISLTDETTGITVFTPHSKVNTMATGTAVVSPGVYTVSVTPPAGVVGAGTTLTSVSLFSDTSFTIFLGGSVPNGEVVALQQNYPNPFNGSTRLPYTLFTDSNVSLNIYNALGRKVKSYYFGVQPAGFYSPLWDGQNDDGRRVASGMYLFQLVTSGQRQSKTMLYLQ